VVVDGVRSGEVGFVVDIESGDVVGVKSKLRMKSLVFERSREREIDFVELVFTGTA